MLHRYRFKNFFSFLDETEISFRLSRHVPETDLSFTCPTGERLSKVLAVIGANGSGKTNAIKPLAFLNWFVRDSFRAEPDMKILPVEPYFFHEDQASEFEVEFDWDNTLWRYHLAITRERVLTEALYRKTSRLFSYVFIREWQGEGKAYHVRQQGFGLNQREAEKVRENASLISTAAQYEVPLARELANTGVHTNVMHVGRSHLDINQVLIASKFFVDQPELQSRVSQLLRSWDLGLKGVIIREIEVTDEAAEKKTMFVPFGQHTLGNNRIELPLFRESSGTQAAFVLLSKLLPVLSNGGIAVIDELEADLHPHMLTPIMDLFFNEETNPHNAQIIFTCHSIEILNLLHKAQVILVEKDENCKSKAWRLDTMNGVRVDDNLYAKYMAGTYGAVPNL